MCFKHVSLGARSTAKFDPREGARSAAPCRVSGLGPSGAGGSAKKFRVSRLRRGVGVTRRGIRRGGRRRAGRRTGRRRPWGSAAGAVAFDEVAAGDRAVVLDREGESGALARAGKLDGDAMVRQFAHDRRPQSAGDLAEVAERLLPSGRRPGGWASRLGRTTRDRSVGHGIGFTAAAASVARHGAFGAEGSGLRYRSGCGRPSSCSASLFSSGQERTSVL